MEQDYLLGGAAFLGGSVLSSPKFKKGLGLTLKEIAGGTKIMSVGTFNSVLDEAINTAKKLQYEKQVGKARARGVSERLIVSGRNTKERGRQMWKTGRDLRKGAKSLSKAYGRVGAKDLKEKALKEIDTGKRLFREGIELEAMGMAMRGEGRLKALKQKSLSLGRRSKIAVKGVGKAGKRATKQILKGTGKIVLSPITARKILTRGRGFGSVWNKLKNKYKKLPKPVQKGLEYGIPGSIFTVGTPLLTNKVIQIIEKRALSKKSKLTPKSKPKRRKDILSISNEMPVLGSRISRKLRKRF